MRADVVEDDDQVSRRVAFALAATVLTAVAPGASAARRPPCEVAGDITYSATTVGFVTTVDLGPCGLVGKVGRVTMKADLRRTDLITGQVTVTRAKPIRCAVRASTCTIRMKVPHDQTELARYVGSAGYQSDGAWRFVAGGFTDSTKCMSVAATYTSCYVPV
jgi:hypothetical protein